jgi:hypothetical protein
MFIFRLDSRVFQSGRQFDIIRRGHDWEQQILIEEGETMFKATVDIATEIAHDLNVSREFVWEIIQGMRYDSIEELEIKVCKAIVGH